MNLKNIILEPVSEGEFLRLRRILGMNISYGNRVNTAKIVEPLRYDNHRALLEDFMKNEYADKISVYGRDGWRRKLARILRQEPTEIFDESVRQIVEAAERDRERPGYLEIHFNAEHRGRSTTKILFRRFDGSIASYGVVTRNPDVDSFSWVTQPSSYENSFYGLWEPN